MRSGLNGRHILIVEDEEKVLTLNRKRLCEQGYSVSGAGSLAEARTEVWERPPDLLILDVLLPDGSGYDFCREFRKISSAPVLFLTCMDKDADVIRGLSCGGDDYLTKPYNFGVLSARIAAMLRRSGGNTGVIELPPLYIDLRTGKVTLSGKDIQLSPKETQLLAYFASNAGRGFTTDELYRTIWGEDGGVSVATVKTHISKLRSKLNLDDAGVFELSFTPERKYIFVKVRFDAD